MDSESGRTLLRHRAHLRPDITSTDKVEDNVIKFQEEIQHKEFNPSTEMMITRSRAKEFSALVLKRKSALRPSSCSPETLLPGGLMGGGESSRSPDFPSC